MKKLITILLTVFLLGSIMTVAVTNTGAISLTKEEKKVRIYNNFKYKTLIMNESEDEFLREYSKVVHIVGYKGKPENLTIPAKLNGLRVYSMEQGLFKDYSSIKKVTIKASFTVSKNAFKDCKNLKKVKFSSNMVIIFKLSFLNCPQLKSVEISETIRDIRSKSLGYIRKNGTYTKVKNFTIYGYEGTVAQTYAEENGFKFKKLT